MTTILKEFVSNFALCLQLVDSKRPQAMNIRSRVEFQPGIGPHTEAQTIRLVSDELAQQMPGKYTGRITLAVPYPEAPRKKCDLCIGSLPKWEWAIEVKMIRFLGDNGKLNDNILMHILSPYPEHRSALTDCAKLSTSSLGIHKAIIIYGFEHADWPLEPAIEAFEALASTKVIMSGRARADFANLVHPIHRAGSVFGWEISSKNKLV